MANIRPTDDTALMWYAVCDEAVGPDNADVTILQHVERNGLNYLKFNACLQSFGKYNRNRRGWKSIHVKPMIESSTTRELLQHGTLAGENGHPVPDAGEASIARIVTINPDKICHRITDFQWKNGDQLLYADIETLDDGVGGVGYKFMRHVLQGLDPSFSLRSVVPQKKNMDGTIDVMGPGRFVTYDRIILPSHEEAYLNTEIPITRSSESRSVGIAMESLGLQDEYANYLLEKSEKIKQIMKDRDAVLESAGIDTERAIFSVKAADGDRLFIAPEMKYRNEISSIFSKF